MIDDSESDSSSEDVIVLCKICSFQKDLTELVILKCEHSFCLLCLEEYVLENLAREVKCPSVDCEVKLTDTQIRHVLSDKDVSKYELLCLEHIPNTHKCLLAECGSIIWYDDGTPTYICSNCSLINCIKCNVAHTSLSCASYKKLSRTKADDICQSALSAAKKVLETKSRALAAESDKIDLLTNDRVFYCKICDLNIAKREGIILRACQHNICRECLKGSIKNTPVIPPKCPEEDCTSTLQDREIYSILSDEEIDIYERKSFTRIKLKLKNQYQCQQPNCNFFCEITDPAAKQLFCLKCNADNCLRCKAVHTYETCDEYQIRIMTGDIGVAEASIQKAIESGECMKCPDCQNLVKKGRGCNWIQCSNCGLELCWILKMRRWGPKGRGDISGGCRCEVEDYCHPDCYGCIPDN